MQSTKSENGYEVYDNTWGTHRQYVNTNQTTDTGIFMINSVHGYPLEQLITLEGNVEAAHEVWTHSGYTAWVVFNVGNHARYLGGCYE